MAIFAMMGLILARKLNTGAYWHMRITYFMTLTACLALMALPAPAAKDAVALPFHTLPAAPAPPPLPWAVPLAGGPVRVGLIAPYSAMGDVARLDGYMDLEIETAALWDRSHLGFDPQFPEPNFPDAAFEKVEQRLTNLFEKRRFDVIVIAQCELDILPATVQEKIVAYASSGTGLIVTGLGVTGSGPLASWLLAQAPVELPALLSRGVGPLGIPTDEIEALLHCFGTENTRVTTLTFSNAPSPNHCLIPVPENPFDVLEEYETDAYALICKAILWTAGREPNVSIRSLIDISPQGPDDEEIPPGYPPEFIASVRKNAFNQPVRPFILNLEAPAEETYDVIYQIRHPGASLPAMLVDPDTVLPKGQAYYALDVIAAPGDYLVDLWIKNRKGVVLWATESITVPGWPQLNDIKVQQDGKKAVWLKPNDHLDVSAVVEPLGLLGSDQEATVFARATDSFGRQVASASQVVGSKGDTLSFRLDLADLLAPLVRVEVYAVPSPLARESGLASQAAREAFFFPVRMADPIREPSVILSADGPFDYGALRQIAYLRDLVGVKALHTPLNADSLLASTKSGLNRIARLGTLDSGMVGTNLSRIPCLSDPEGQRQEQAAIANGVLQAWAGGAPYYSLGSGCALTSTEAELCQSIHCLKEFRQYLQEHYVTLGALNTAWRESFTSWDEVAPWPLDQCQQLGVWAPWLDFRQSMDKVFSEAQRRGREAVHTVDGSGRVGFEARHGDITPMTGYNWQQLCAANDYLAVPPEAGAMRRLQSFQGIQPYSGIVLGNDNLSPDPAQASWTVWNALFYQLPALWLDQPIGVGADSLISPVGEPRPGLAALAESLRTIQAGIGTLVLNALPHPTGIAFVDSPATQYLDYANPGVKHGTAASEDGIAATLNRDGFTASIRSLDPSSPFSSLEGINTLILCRARAMSEQELARLKAFHENNGLIVADGRPAELDEHGSPRPSVALPFLHPLDPEISEDAATLWTNRPVWVSQSGLDAKDEDTILAHLLERAGNPPILPAQLPEKQLGAVARYQYQFGAATLVAFLPEPGASNVSRRASMKLPKGLYATDLLHPMDTSPRNKIQWIAMAGEPALYSLLPYRVKQLLVEAPDIAVAGHRASIRVVLDTGEATPGTHLILLQLEGPDGKELLHYRQCLPMDGGVVETFIPLAENEQSGHYMLQVCDLLSQQHVAYAMDIAS